MLCGSKWVMVIVSSVALLSAGAVYATEYLFTVTCENESYVAQWNTGDIDPGREYLRVATGMNNSGCSISDFDKAVDEDLRREKYDGGGAIIKGLPPLEILRNIFG